MQNQCNTSLNIEQERELWRFKNRPLKYPFSISLSPTLMVAVRVSIHNFQDTKVAEIESGLRSCVHF